MFISTMLRPNIVIVCLCALCVILGLHVYVNWATRHGEKSKVRLFKYITVKQSSFAMIVFAILPVAQTAIATAHGHPCHSSMDRCCRFSTAYGIAMIAAHQLASYLFLSMRSQLVRPTPQIVWILIGFVLSLSDFCLIIFILCEFLEIKAYRKNGVCLEQVSMTIYIWIAINDFVLGIFCLLVFVLPLLTLIKVEEAAMVLDSQFRDVIDDGHQWIVYQGAEVSR